MKRRAYRATEVKDVLLEEVLRSAPARPDLRQQKSKTDTSAYRARQSKTDTSAYRVGGEKPASFLLDKSESLV
jgi:hypothetical protein